jgi:hypothetical protein
MSLSRHGEIYHFDEGAILANHALAHRIDEFPAGYSSAGCSPAEPTSASPASAIVLGLILNAKDFAVKGKLSPITVSQPRGSLQYVPEFPLDSVIDLLQALANKAEEEILLFEDEKSNSL